MSCAIKDAPPVSGMIVVSLLAFRAVSACWRPAGADTDIIGLHIEGSHRRTLGRYRTGPQAGLVDDMRLLPQLLSVVLVARILPACGAPPDSMTKLG